MHDKISNTVSETQSHHFHQLDSYNLDTDPFPTKGSNMDLDSNNSNRSVYMSDNDAVNDVTHPSENLLVSKVVYANYNIFWIGADRFVLNNSTL